MHTRDQLCRTFNRPSISYHTASPASHRSLRLTDRVQRECECLHTSPFPLSAQATLYLVRRPPHLGARVLCTQSHVVSGFQSNCHRIGMSSLDVIQLGQATDFCMSSVDVIRVGEGD